MNEWPLSGRPVATTYRMNRQKVNELIQEYQQISQRGIAKIKNMSIWVTKRVCSTEVVPHPLSL